MNISLKNIIKNALFRRKNKVYITAGNAYILNRTPEEWLTPAISKPFVRNTQPSFHPDEMIEPSNADIEQWKAETPIVRRMPYPFTAAVNIASDCCATKPADYFYTGTLLSQRYGLDLGSSFWVYSPRVENKPLSLFSRTRLQAMLRNLLDLFKGVPKRTLHVPALFSGGSEFRPTSSGVMIENERIDWWPYFLIIYYRGWADHLHSWSTKGLPDTTVVYPQELVLHQSSIAEVELSWLGFPWFAWVGMALDIEINEYIEAFEIEIREKATGYSHWITYGRPLNGRSGWEASEDNFYQGLYIFMLEDAENPIPKSLLGKAGSYKITASLIIYGNNGGKVILRSLSLLEMNAALAEQQAEIIKDYNILPLTSTAHGGYNMLGGLCNSFGRGELSRNWPDKNKYTSVMPLLNITGDSSNPAFNIGRAFQTLSTRFYGCGGYWDMKPQRLGSIRPLFNHLPVYKVGTYYFMSNESFKPPTSFFEKWENMGSLLAQDLAGMGNRPLTYGDNRVWYQHFNLFSPELFGKATTRLYYMNEVKRLNANLEYAFDLLSLLKYNLDGRREWYQRIWVVPFPVLMRYEETLKELTKHTRLNGDRVEIAPWINSVTGQTVPDPVYAAQDLHGQTFYVHDSSIARVFHGENEITSLKRNPPDFTGRPSVTVIDGSCPTRIFGELHPSETNTQVIMNGASYKIANEGAYSGQYALEIKAEQHGEIWIDLLPHDLNSHETDYIRFAYRKTNPDSKIITGWGAGETIEFMATEGDLGGLQGWRIHKREDADWHEVVLDYADISLDSGQQKRIPRVDVAMFRLGLQNVEPGDSVFFDNVDFLSARGNRPQTGNGLVIGGQIYPVLDGEIVTMNVGGETYTTRTERGGWYIFTGIPAGSIAEIVYECDMKKYYPMRGRRLEALKNDMEYHIKTVNNNKK